MSVFGTLISDYQIEQAVLATLTANYDDFYLAEVERQTTGQTVGFLARPRSWQSSYDFENWLEGQLPALVVVCPGTAEDLQRFQDDYKGWFEVRVGVLVEDTTEANARKVAQLHQAALEGILVQTPNLANDFAVDLTLVSRQTDLPDVENRTFAYAESVFHVFVDSLVSHMGPDGPGPNPEDPAADWPTVLTTSITLDTIPAGEDIPGTMDLPDPGLFPGSDVIPGS